MKNIRQRSSAITACGRRMALDLPICIKARKLRRQKVKLNWGKKRYEELDIDRRNENGGDDVAAERGLGVSMITRLALAVVVIVSLIICITSLMRYNKLEEERAELQAQIDAYDKDIAEKEYLIDAPIDDDYIIRIARDKLGLFFPDEVVYYNNTND
ncbi:MAG: septum formation initiator family protein [Ruminococcaceae bacterium]|nr:septum formation initiator family protein [Oscillospiraceae bacterium]